MKKVIPILIFIIMSGCGFKVLNLSEIENYNLVKVFLISQVQLFDSIAFYASQASLY